jgi:hypothetical protein
MIGSLEMTVTRSSPLPGVSRDVLRLQAFTFIWMRVEAFVSLMTAWHTHRPALFAIGGDSLIELRNRPVANPRMSGWFL